MAQNTVSLQLTAAEASEVRDILSAYGWTEDIVSNEYMVLRMRFHSSAVCTLYTSHKIVFQGNEDFSKIITMIKNGCDVHANILPHLGVDEVGKGDYFGPLVVVACFVDQKIIDKVACLGVGDSKKFSDKRIMDMYYALDDYPYYYSSIVYPSEYNQLYLECGNASILLARQHSKVIEMGLKDLKEKNIDCKRVVIDQFSSSKDRVLNELGDLAREIEFVQFHKGESDIAVATASVLARGIFLEEMKSMCMKYNFDFPKGASNVISPAKMFVSKFGVDELEKVAKTTFKTTGKVLQSSF